MVRSELSYLSCFSGIGGLEGESKPELLCEIDPVCREILRVRYPDRPIHSDIRQLNPPTVDVVAGGWPCQDLSIAGRQAGLSGSKSSLLVELLRVASKSGASTIVAENVANLLTMQEGREFQLAVRMFHDAGYTYVSWRILNARQFGLPQHRTRLIVIASKSLARSQSLFRPVPSLELSAADPSKATLASGFYWTAGTHSINYSVGYVPTLKVGSGLNIPSPPAVLYGDVIRPLSPLEALNLQGFDGDYNGIPSADLYRLAGNAVARPMGRWVFQGLELEALNLAGVLEASTQASLFGGGLKRFQSAGISMDGTIQNISVPRTGQLAVNLIDYLDKGSTVRLSQRAASGLRSRLERSGQTYPEILRQLLPVYSSGSTT